LARETSGLEKLLTLRSLVKIRIITPIMIYFVVSVRHFLFFKILLLLPSFVQVFYSLLSLAFHLPFHRKYVTRYMEKFIKVNLLSLADLGMEVSCSSGCYPGSG
jgi:hypothetical protein